MRTVGSVYIVESDDQGWIIERLMRDVVTELRRRGIAAELGPGDSYGGQDVAFNSRYLTPTHQEGATVNSLFITHVDDRLREAELRSLMPGYNSLVCLSPQDAAFVAGVKGSPRGVIGIELPTRDTVARPLRVAMFSAWYPDGRKNEAWILDYLRGRPPELRRRLVFCFLGADWERFCERVARLGGNYEILSYSRDMPGEYGYYREALATMHALVYPGFDGGAMSVYDGLAAGLDVIASDTSYHRGLGEGVRLFADQAGFEAELDRFATLHSARAQALAGRSVQRYVDRLLAHWNQVAGCPPAGGLAQATEPPNDEALGAVEAHRDRYQRLGPSRLRSYLIRVVLRLFRS